MSDKSEEKSQAVRGLLVRWCVVLLLAAVLTGWSTLRMRQASTDLLKAVGGVKPVSTAEAEIEYWTCSMHPDVHSQDPGDCPKCGMELIPKYMGSDEPGVAPLGGAGASHKHKKSEPKVWYMCTMPECGDQGSDDPNSRCPVCGMKRERVMLDVGADVGEAEVSLSEHARLLAGVATEPVKFRQLSKRIRTVGKVSYDEPRRKMVSAWTGGRIDRLFADFTGMVVQDGDHLVEVYSPQLVSAQEEFLQAIQAAAALGESATGISKRHAEQLVVSARTKLELLGIDEKQIEEIVRTKEAATHLVVHAPIGGTIVRKWAVEGKYVKTGDPLYEIADLTHVWLLLDMYEADLPWVVPFLDVDVTAESLPGEKFTGQVVFVDPLVDEKTRTIKVRVNVDNPELRLKPEMFVTAEINVPMSTDGRAAMSVELRDYACPMHPWEMADEVTHCPICGMDLVPTKSIRGLENARVAADVLSVPAESVMKTGERSLVYVETEEGVYRGVAVEVGPQARDSRGRKFYPVLSGLTEGEQVVVRGNFAIDSQMQIAGKPSLFSARGVEVGTPTTSEKANNGSTMEGHIHD